ncbi:MAG: hypothetical protein HZA63_15620 [Rhodocyclales bacterium]|nr:hypothetical protein [Rhodocyclales bacterium]
MQYEIVADAARATLKWSLPAKWSFWASVIGIPLGLISLLLGVLPLVGQDQAAVGRGRLVLQVAQELRYNDEWLSSLSIAIQRRSPQLPVGSLKTDGLARLLQREHDRVVSGAYGEEKFIYQHVLLLRDLGAALGSPKSGTNLDGFRGGAKFSLHDIHFLNNFLFWYVRPLMVDELSDSQLYSLGRSGLPGERFKIDGVSRLDMKNFVDEGKPIVDYGRYLGLID